MKSNSIQSFAIGLLVATGVFAAVYYLAPSETTTQTVKVPSEDEMKIALTDKGYVIQTEEEWNQQQVAVEEAKKNIANSTYRRSPS